MNKEALSFLHDSNAQNDSKILELRAIGGWEYYGLYWALVERLRDVGEGEGNYALPLKHVNGLALALGVTREFLQKFLEHCFALGLLQKDKNNFWSDSLNRRLARFNEARKKLSEARSNAAKSSWEKRKNKEKQSLDANAMQEQSKSNASVKQSQSTLNTNINQNKNLNKSKAPAETVPINYLTSSP